ncbi:MAG: hypothetical protein Q9192_006319 [Flavoplaca navasiana]
MLPFTAGSINGDEISALMQKSPASQASSANQSSSAVKRSYTTHGTPVHNEKINSGLQVSKSPRIRHSGACDTMEVNDLYQSISEISLLTYSSDYPDLTDLSRPWKVGKSHIDD